MQLRIEQYRGDVEDKQRRIREGDEQILKVEGGLKASRSQMDKFLREYDQLHQKTIQLTDDLDNQMHTNQLLANDLNERESEIFRKRSECEQVRREDRRIEKLGRLTDKKVAKVQAERQALEDKKAAAGGDMLLCDELLRKLVIVRQRARLCVRADAHTGCAHAGGL